MMRSFVFSRAPFTFSITAADHAVVEAALLPQPGHRILSICSAGDTALNLLTRDVAEVFVVDSNPAQIHLAQLKATAAAHLDVGAYRALLGARRKAFVESDYDAVARHLPDAARQFWQQHKRLMRKGVLWQGRVQELFRAMRFILRIAIGKHGLEALRNVRSSADADVFIATFLRAPRAQLATGIIFSRPFFALYYPRHGFRHLPPGQTPRDFALQRIEQALRRVTIADNPYLQAFLFDAYPDLEDGPPYLREAGHALVRSRIERLQWYHGDLRDVLAGLPRASVDGFDLCNVVDWMDRASFSNVLESVLRVARPGARILLFSRSGPPELSGDLARRCRMEQQLSAELSRSERTGYYANVNVLVAV